jgi:CHASE3 domain sensor protein
MKFSLSSISAIFIVLVAAYLQACSDNASDSDNAASIVIDPQIQALEKAKNVEAQILDAANQQRALIDKQSQ